MMTGEQYKKSLNDNRETYFEGERIRDLVTHPLLGECVSRIAHGYDQFYSPEPGAVSPLMAIPRSAAELRDRSLRQPLHLRGLRDIRGRDIDIEACFRQLILQAAQPVSPARRRNHARAFLRK